MSLTSPTLAARTHLAHVSTGEAIMLIQQLHVY